MKKIIPQLILFFAVGLSLTMSVSAASPSPSQAPLNSKLNDQINDLKDRIASRVAQLKLVERRGILGSVTAVTDTQITLNDLSGNTRFVDVDELTRFSSPSAKGSFGISDITKGTKLGILGLYNKQSQRILARFVEVTVLPRIIHGTITDIDNKNFTITLLTEDGQRIVADIENSTKILSYTKDGGLKKTGFSKVSGDAHTIAVGFSDKTDKNKISASRIILFSELPKNPRIVVPQDALVPKDTVIPSTGSGKKLTPITR